MSFKTGWLTVVLVTAFLGINGLLVAGPSSKHRMGIGLGAGGNPSNLFIAGKYWLKRRGTTFTPALDFAFRGGNGWVGGDMDYLLHKFYIFKGSLGRRLPLYFGGGVGLGFSNSNIGIQVQGKGGLTYFFDAPFDVFVEGIPAVSLTPNVGVDIGLALGGRYYW